MRKQKNILVLFLLCTNFIFCSNAKAQELESVKAFYQPIISWAPMIIANQEGFFKEQGIDLKLIKGRDVGEAFILIFAGCIGVKNTAVGGAGVNTNKYTCKNKI